MHFRATVHSKRVMPITIVVADDDPDYRLLVRLILASASGTMAVIGEARDGEEAFELVRRDRRPDIVISDLLMPRLNGIELTRRIKDQQPQTNVILLSAYTGEAYRRVASASGVDGFVSKQLVHSDLLPAIRDVIVRRVSEAVANRAQAGSPGRQFGHGPRRPPRPSRGERIRDRSAPRRRRAPARRCSGPRLPIACARC